MSDGVIFETRAEDLESALRGLFPVPVAVAVLPIDPQAQPEHGAEAEATVPMRHARRAEFLTGRRALRRAISALGVACGAIPIGACRAPVLPPGVAASLSHAGGLCVAVASRGGQSLGVDIDLARPLTLSEGLLPVVLTPEDTEHLARLPQDARDLAAMQVFSCKEAFYKAQFPLTGRLLDFHAVDITLGEASFTARLRQDVGPFRTGQTAPGRTSLAGRFVLSGLALEA